MTPPVPGPRVLYISGPFSHPDPVHGIPKNILLASDAGDIALPRDPDPAPLLRGEPRHKTGHIVPSRDDGDVTPHLVICVHPDHLYLAVKGEVREVREGRLDICKVVSA